MRILLAEDETRMAAALIELLGIEGYDVDHVADGPSALLALEGGIYDIAVLDVMMPGMNGFDVVRTARREGIGTPVIMLTAKGQVEDKVHGLDSGADDYLAKPFQTDELLARIRALGRRAMGSTDGLLHYGDLRLDVKAALLTCSGSGKSVRLSAKELRLLEYLMINKKSILSRQQLASRIWGYDNDSEYNNVEVYMSFARKRIAAVDSMVQLKAVRGLGYMLGYEDVQ